MLVLIAGGGRTGTQLARFLLDQNHEVRMVEHRPEIIARLHRELPTEVIIEGNPTDLEVLERANIRGAQVVAACTVTDADNLVLCYLARHRYQVPRTIARINNPRNSWLFNEKFHVDVALNQSAIMAHLIEEEMSVGDMITLLKLKKGDFALVKETISEGAQVVGVALKDLGLPENVVIAAIVRNGKILVPRGLSIFDAGDEILAITDSSGADLLEGLFGPPETRVQAHS